MYGEIPYMGSRLLKGLKKSPRCVMHRGLCYVESKFKKHLFFTFLPFYFFTFSLFYNDWLVLRNQCLHDAPAYEVSNTTDAEYNHVGTWLAIEAHEAEG